MQGPSSLPQAVKWAWQAPRGWLGPPRMKITLPWANQPHSRAASSLPSTSTLSCVMHTSEGAVNQFLHAAFPWVLVLPSQLTAPLGSSLGSCWLSSDAPRLLGCPGSTGASGIPAGSTGRFLCSHRAPRNNPECTASPRQAPREGERGESKTKHH